MSKKEMAGAVLEVLRRAHDLRCELGTIRLYEMPPYAGRNPRTGEAVAVPAKRYPVFAPSRQLIAASFGGAAIPVPAERYARDPRPNGARLYDLTSADRSTDDYANEAIGDRPIGAATDELVVGDALLREIGDGLRERKKLGVSGFGTFRTRRLPRRALDEDDDRPVVDADLAGKWIIAVRFSHVLLDAINGRA